MTFRKPLWSLIAAGSWGAVLVTLLVRAGIHPDRATSFTTYLAGGAAWRDSDALYTHWRGFVYPPVVGWFFSLLTYLPLGVAAVLWRGIASGVFLVGLGGMLRAGVFRRIPAAWNGMVFLAALPLAIGNIDNAQANPFIAGLMMLSVAALEREAWMLCAVAIGIATTFKIYPVALGLLLCVLRPKEISWRYLLVLAGLAALPFAVKDGHYVLGQYRAWWETRLADDRFHYPMKDAPLDLWYLLVRLGHLPVSTRVYTALQIAAGGALAGLVWRRRSVREMYLLVTVWMLLLGPATENQTYVVLGPAAALLLVEGYAGGGRRVARWLAGLAYALLLGAVARNSLLPHFKGPWAMAIQPVGAIVLLAAIFASEARAAQKYSTLAILP